MDKIERDVYLCQHVIVQSIEYPQGSNAVPIIFYLRDYTIPDNAYYTTVYFRKPSGHEIYDCGEIEQTEDKLTFNVSEQMTCESGVMMMTVSICEKSGVVCNAFNVPFIVQPTSLASDSGITSCDEYTALEELIQEALNYSTTLEEIKEGIHGLYDELDEAEEYIKEFLKNYDATLKQFEEELQESFMEWFESIKDTLAGDVAGNLQVEIEALQEAVAELREEIVKGTVYTGLGTEDQRGLLTSDGRMLLAARNFRKGGNK